MLLFPVHIVEKRINVNITGNIWLHGTTAKVSGKGDGIPVVHEIINTKTAKSKKAFTHVMVILSTYCCVFPSVVCTVGNAGADRLTLHQHATGKHIHFSLAH